MPPFPKDSREFRYANKLIVPDVALEGVHSDGHLGISRIDHNEPFTKILLDNFFAFCNSAQQEGCSVTVEIEIKEPPAAFDILLREVPKRGRFAGSGFTEHRNVLGAAFVRDRDAAADFAINDPRSHIEPSGIHGRVSGAIRYAIPQPNQQLFEEVFHISTVGPGVSKTVTIRSPWLPEPTKSW